MKKHTKKIAPVSFGTYDETHKEHNDCFVRAVANITGMEYEDAHELCKKHGRINRHSTSFHVTHKVMKELGYKLVSVFGKCSRTAWLCSNYDYDISERESSKTLGQFTKELPKGKFLLIVTGHATVVKDGKLVDMAHIGSSKRVLCAFYNPNNVFN